MHTDAIWYDNAACLDTKYRISNVNYLYMGDESSPQWDSTLSKDAPDNYDWSTDLRLSGMINWNDPDLNKD